MQKGWNKLAFNAQNLPSTVSMCPSLFYQYKLICLLNVMLVLLLNDTA